MASQMAPAVFDTTTVDFDLGRYLFRSTGSVVKFDGFLALYREAHEEGDGRALEDEQALPVARSSARTCRSRDHAAASISPSRRRASAKRAW